MKYEATLPLREVLTPDKEIPMAAKKKPAKKSAKKPAKKKGKKPTKAQRQAWGRKGAAARKRNAAKKGAKKSAAKKPAKRRAKKGAAKKGAARKPRATKKGARKPAKKGARRGAKKGAKKAAKKSAGKKNYPGTPFLFVVSRAKKCKRGKKIGNVVTDNGSATGVEVRQVMAKRGRKNKCA